MGCLFQTLELLGSVEKSLDLWLSLLCRFGGRDFTAVDNAVVLSSHDLLDFAQEWRVGDRANCDLALALHRVDEDLLEGRRVVVYWHKLVFASDNASAPTL